MKNKDQRKREVLSSLLRKESWELEAIKNDNTRAQQILDRETRALDQANEALDATFLELRRLMDNEASLQFDTLQTMRLYLAEKNREQLEQQSRQRHVLSEADRIAQQLRRKMLYTQGLEDIETITSKSIETEREKTALREIEELWAQQYRKRK